MPRPLRWRQLVPGVVITALIGIAVFAVLTRARVGGIRGHTVRYYTAVASARDVLKGTEVWLDGQKAGLVYDVRLGPVTVDTSKRLVVALDILDQPARNLRRDSRADVRPGGTLIGAPVIYISSGTPHAEPLAVGDTIQGWSSKEIDLFGTANNFAKNELPALFADLRSL